MVEIYGNKADSCKIYLNAHTYPEFANYLIANVYESDGVNGLFYHDGQGTYTNASLEAKDNSYRYNGPNPNNYVCFGSYDDVCPLDSLYRIIGIFGDKVKLIKSDYSTSEMLGTDLPYRMTYSEWEGTSGDIGLNSNYLGEHTGDEIAAYSWNIDESEGGNPIWSESNLNTVSLNKHFIDYLGDDWVNKIADTTWQAGGNDSRTLLLTGSVYSVYAYEVVNPEYDRKVNAKIGLMYMSDFGYASDSKNWTSQFGDYSSYYLNNWMYMGLIEWTMTPCNYSPGGAIRVHTKGFLDNRNLFGWAAIRPVFFLKSEVKIVDGDGSKSNPYRVI